MRVLLSIRPEHVAHIMAGVKTFEFRRRIFTRSDVRTVVIYCTKPVGMVVGEFHVNRIIKGKPKHIWQVTKHGAGITKEYFDSYFSGRDVGYALQIGGIRAFAPHLDPGDLFHDFTPPQSFRYLVECTSQQIHGQPAWEGS